VLLTRLSVARWLLMAIGSVVVAYYLAAIILFVARGGVQLLGLPALALLLWTAATVTAVLPVTARAMRRWNL